MHKKLPIKKKNNSKELRKEESVSDRQKTTNILSHPYRSSIIVLILQVIQKQQEDQNRVQAPYGYTGTYTPFPPVNFSRTKADHRIECYHLSHCNSIPAPHKILSISQGTREIEQLKQYKQDR